MSADAMRSLDYTKLSVAQAGHMLRKIPQLPPSQAKNEARMVAYGLRNNTTPTALIYRAAAAYWS